MLKAAAERDVGSKNHHKNFDCRELFTSLTGRLRARNTKATIPNRLAMTANGQANALCCASQSRPALMNCDNASTLMINGNNTNQFSRMLRTTVATSAQ